MTRSERSTVDITEKTGARDRRTVTFVQANSELDEQGQMQLCPKTSSTFHINKKVTARKTVATTVHDYAQPKKDPQTIFCAEGNRLQTNLAQKARGWEDGRCEILRTGLHSRISFRNQIFKSSIPRKWTSGINIPWIVCGREVLTQTLSLVCSYHCAGSLMSYLQCSASKSTTKEAVSEKYLISVVICIWKRPARAGVRIAKIFAV